MFGSKRNREIEVLTRPNKKSHEQILKDLEDNRKQAELSDYSRLRNKESTDALIQELDSLLKENDISIETKKEAAKSKVELLSALEQTSNIDSAAKVSSERMKVKSEAAKERASPKDLAKSLLENAGDLAEKAGEVYGFTRIFFKLFGNTVTKWMQENQKQDTSNLTGLEAIKVTLKNRVWDLGNIFLSIFGDGPMDDNSHETGKTGDDTAAGSTGSGSSTEDSTEEKESEKKKSEIKKNSSNYLDYIKEKNEFKTGIFKKETLDDPYNRLLNLEMLYYNRHKMMFDHYVKMYPDEYKSLKKQFDTCIKKGYTNKQGRKLTKDYSPETDLQTFIDGKFIVLKGNSIDLDKSDLTAWLPMDSFPHWYDMLLASYNDDYRDEIVKDIQETIKTGVSSNTDFSKQYNDLKSLNNSVHLAYDTDQTGGVNMFVSAVKSGSIEYVKSYYNDASDPKEAIMSIAIYQILHRDNGINAEKDIKITNATTENTIDIGGSEDEDIKDDDNITVINPEPDFKSTNSLVDNNPDILSNKVQPDLDFNSKIFNDNEIPDDVLTYKESAYLEQDNIMQLPKVNLGVVNNKRIETEGKITSDVDIPIDNTVQIDPDFQSNGWSQK